MKKLFLVLALVLCFSACINPNAKQDEAIVEDTTKLEMIDTACVEAIEIDTTYCRAITLKGEQCKNHPVTGDTLCNIHRKNK